VSIKNKRPAIRLKMATLGNLHEGIHLDPTAQTPANRSASHRFRFASLLFQVVIFLSSWQFCYLPAIHRTVATRFRFRPAPAKPPGPMLKVRPGKGLTTGRSERYGKTIRFGMSSPPTVRPAFVTGRRRTYCFHYSSLLAHGAAHPAASGRMGLSYLFTNLFKNLFTHCCKFFRGHNL